MVLESFCCGRVSVSLRGGALPLLKTSAITADNCLRGKQRTPLVPVGSFITFAHKR